MFKPKKWNISLIVLFILTITSLLGLLAFQNVQSMIKINLDDLFATKSLYYSRAWVELWVALSNGYGIWFEDKITNQDALNNNFQCSSNNQCGTEFIISNRSRTYLTNIPWNNQECIEENRFKLEEWESLIVPLFLDNRKLDIENSWEEFESILPSFKNNSANAWKNLSFDLFLEPIQTSWTDILLSFALGSWDYDLDRDVLFKIYTWINKVNASNLIDNFLYDTTPLYYKKDKTDKTKEIEIPIESKVSKFSQIPNFLVINYPTHCPDEPWKSDNLGDIIEIYGDWSFNCNCWKYEYSWDVNKCIDEDWIPFMPVIKRKLEFCLKVWENLQENGVATNAFLIDSQWKYWLQHISLQAIKKTALPSWLFSTAIDKSF